MGRLQRGALPRISVHPRSGNARVRYQGREIWLGRHGSPEAQAKFNQLVHEIVSDRLLPRSDQDRVLGDGKGKASETPAGPPEHHQPLETFAETVLFGNQESAETGPTIAEMCSRFLVHAERFYRDNHGEPTSTLGNIKTAIRALRRFDDMSAAEFGPILLEELMHSLASEKVPCRKSGRRLDYRPRVTVNRTIKTIRMIFDWAVSRELVPPEKTQAMKSLKLLAKGRTLARELPKVRPVDDAVVEQTLPQLPRVVADMVRLQRLTGCRPGEVCQIRPGDIDRERIPWIWRLDRHKNEWREQDSEIAIGPRGRALLEPYLARPADWPCFLSNESEKERNTQRRRSRKSPMTPSQRRRRQRTRLKKSHQRPYAGASYRRAITRACEKLGIKHWTPNQLRHSAATETRAKHGLEAAQSRLGHKHAKTTEIYAETDRRKAMALAEEFG